MQVYVRKVVRLNDVRHSEICCRVVYKTHYHVNGQSLNNNGARKTTDVYISLEYSHALMATSAENAVL